MPVRQRHGKANSREQQHYRSGDAKRNKRGFALQPSHVALALSALAAVCWAGYLGYRMYQRHRVTSPIDLPRVAPVTDSDPGMLWGSYRPGVYFGMKARVPGSPVVGLAWWTETRGTPAVRHDCRHGDGLQRYGWTKHDGRNFGSQEIVDGSVVLRTEFAKQPLWGGWSARIAVTKATERGSNNPVSLVVYIATEDPYNELEPVMDGVNLDSVQGRSSELGWFRLGFHSDNQSQRTTSYFLGNHQGFHQLNSVLESSIRPTEGRSVHLLSGDRRSEGRTPDLVAYQLVGSLPLVLEVSYSTQQPAPVGPQLSALLARLSSEFDVKFARVFGISSAAGFNDSQIGFAQSAVSNMLGGIGYFHGHVFVSSEFHEPGEVNAFGPFALYTGVPSRSFFPRGFLWDEGFHLLLVSRWDPDIARDIASHWLNLMNSEGWIPRETILGLEARARVPSEFVVQRNTDANPPSLLLALDSLRSSSPEFLRAAFPRLVAWYDWFNATQTSRYGAYRWRGRNATTTAELNPKTLTSGLDDYPRASHPGDHERHLDLLCWMARISGVLGRIATAVGEPAERFLVAASQLSASVVSQHWSTELNAFADYGLHSGKVTLVRPPSPPGGPPGESKPQKYRKVLEEPKLGFVDSFGYVSLFPLAMKLLPADSPLLGRLLEELDDPTLLWTPYGLRSLSRRHPLYMKRNTEHDPPYWRGAVWVNINYLVVEGLRHYELVAGPHRHRARELRSRLQGNLVRTVYRQYVRTGYIWESYSDSTGKGQGTHPFTGWSALVVLLMDES